MLAIHPLHDIVACRTQEYKGKKDALNTTNTPNQKQHVIKKKKKTAKIYWKTQKTHPNRKPPQVTSLIAPLPTCPNPYTSTPPTPRKTPQ